MYCFLIIIAFIFSTSFSYGQSKVLLKDSNDDPTYVITGAGKIRSENSLIAGLNKLSTYHNLNASLNEYVDRTCRLMNNNTDVELINLPNKLRHFLMFKINTYDRQLRGLSTISRKGICYVNYEVKLLLLITKFNFKQLQVSYQLLLHYSLFKQHFKFNMIMNNVDVETAILVDATNASITMDRLVIPNVQDMTFHISGEGAIGWIINKIVAVINYLFQTPLIRHIEDVVADEIQEAFNNLPYFNRNERIPVSPYCEN
ncbi:uncharacterized protein LOC142321398 [Lycorma delicatula]|uniref:uncharacterized protein LOC142321398 n=1 Tax=Lycorma delicatula TaxID=130591 RepID=UPI003F5135C7